MKKAKYKVIGSSNGLPELEEKVSQLLNEGWKPIGGIAFNHGYPYQAMGKVEEEKKMAKESKEEGRARTANEAMRELDQLT